MRYVQLVLTESQVSLLARAAGNAMLDSDEETERGQLAALADFLYAVEANPDGFPVTSPTMRRALKKRISRLKGPAQKKPNKRKRAQLRSQGAQKRTRAQKREEALLFNQAREAAEEALRIEQAEEWKSRADAVGIVLPDSETT